MIAWLMRPFPRYAETKADLISFAWVAACAVRIRTHRKAHR